MCYELVKAVVVIWCRLVSARKARPRRTRPSTGNPLRTLQEQGLTVDEYVEVRTDVAERELKRIKHEQSTATQRLTVGHNHGRYMVVCLELGVRCRLFVCIQVNLTCLQCFDAVGWAAGRASGQ